MALTGSFTIPKYTRDTTISQSIVNMFPPEYPCAELRSTTASSWWIYPSGSTSDTNYDGKYIMIESLNTSRYHTEGELDQLVIANFNVYNNKAQRDTDIKDTIDRFAVEFNTTLFDLGSSLWDQVYGSLNTYSGSQGNFTNLIQD